MTRRSWLLILVFYAILLVILFLPSHPPAPPLVGYTAEVNSTRMSSFSVNDTGVRFLVGFNGTISDRYNVTTVWLTPQGHRYGRPTQGIIAKSGVQLIYTIPINGSDMIESPGQWSILTYVNGTKSTVVHFQLYDPRPPKQPVEYFTWPSSAIDVRVTGPSVSKTDVAQAVEQWNHSLMWFEQNFSLPNSPTYELILSNSTSSSGISITFNGTQSNQDLGITNWQWNQTAGRILSLRCIISIDLHYKNGEPLNDIALRNLALHEIGHCLGLAHVPHDGDAMNHDVASPYDYATPSTLNLYAIYQMMAYEGRFVPANTIIVLPSGIPYEPSPNVAP